MDPNQQPHIPQTPRAPAPRPRSPPPPGWVDPNFRRWRVENGLARIVEGPESSRPKGDGIFEYAGHVGPYQPTSETIRTRTVRRVPRQGSQQVVPQDAVQPQIVQQMQRTYSAPVVAPGQQNQHQQPLPSPPAVQQTQYVQHTPIPSQLAPVQQPLYQQQHQQQILAQQSVQTQASSLSTRTTSHGGVQTAHVPQAISVQQGVQQGHYATTQAQTQQRSHGSNGQQMQYAARQAQALPPPAHTTQQSQIRPLVQSHYSATSDVIGTSKSIHIAGTSTSGGINHVQRKAPATSAFAQGAGVCVGMNKKTNSLTHGQMHAVEQANAILQQMGLAPAIRMASAGFAMQGQGGINIFISPHLAERDWRHCHTVPFRRRPQFTGSTTIAGYNTANWGGGARQVAVRKGPKRLAEYDDEVSDHLAQAGKGVCPMNWRWYPVRQGYFCGGGNHLISHIEAESTMAGQRPQGPYVQLVNLEPEAPSRMVTPPPSPGDGNWILVGPGLRDAQRRREYHPLPKNCKGECRHCTRPSALIEQSQRTRNRHCSLYTVNAGTAENLRSPDDIPLDISKKHLLPENNMNPLQAPSTPSPFANGPQQDHVIHQQQAQDNATALPAAYIQQGQQSLHQNSGVVHSQTTTTSTTTTTTQSAYAITQAHRQPRSVGTVQQGVVQVQDAHAEFYPADVDDHKWQAKQTSFSSAASCVKQCHQGTADLKAASRSLILAKMGAAGFYSDTAKEGPQALAEYDDEISDHIAHASMGVCPMNWRWYPVKRGYLCGGTKHLISYEEAEATKRGERREKGPFVESVNIALGPAVAAMGFERTRSITPPPGPGDRNSMVHGALPKNAAGWYFDGWTYVKDKPEYWPWDE
ncbi:hypothetical protein B0A48_10500 [Cryoendolithus antarcticus]|uniref:Uncharacterized protein n=1 Tax=Cryoendolithus antarcticus TaxID=1507870 RepID=A0A1V8SXQ8_9PEZI|nr:hypothetical protein B0A48_10500 [Cryoendolithus antarcticus]